MRRDDLTKCGNCKRHFPDHLVNPLRTNAGPIRNVCPICALVELNRMHGLPLDTPFQGEQAQDFYEEAMEFIRRQAAARGQP